MRWTARLAATATLLAALAACGRGTPAAGPAPARSSSPVTSAPASPAPSGSPATTPRTQPSSAKPTPPPSPSPRPGPSPITGRLAGIDWTYIPTSRHVVALTFDAGANADGVPSILATLRRDRVAGTFFLTGNFTREFPHAAKAIAAAGERIGNHTMTHPYLTTLSNAEVRRQILSAARQIIAVTGQNPAPLFRFPFGDTNARTIAIANRLGYVSVRWTVDTLGWEGKAGHISPSVVVARVLAALRPGEIVLMHVGSNPDDHTTFDADALPRVISEIRARGYTFVTLNALAG